MQAQRESTQAVTNARLTRAPAKLRTRRTLKRAKTPKSATRTLLPRAGKPVLHKVPLPSATATQFRSAAASHKIPDRQWRGAPAPVGFAPSRRGRGRRVSRSQVKVQTRRITGSTPPSRTCETSLGCASARCAEHSPTISEAGRGCHKNRSARGEGSAKTAAPACIRLATSGARCLPAKMPKKGDNSNRNSKKSQKKDQKKYKVYSQKTVRIKEALREKQ